MTGLSIDTVSITYGKRPIIEGLSLPAFLPGEVTCLAGPNAAGKSTLLRAIAQLARYRGRITLDGTDMSQLSAIQRAGKIGFMPQSLPAGSSLIVLESVIAALRAAGEGNTHAADETAMAVLERLGIASLALEQLDQLSGGQRQMVSLAQAIVRDPRLLLLDEPTSALDLARQVRLLSEMRRLAAEGRVVIVVLHDLALAAQWSDRVVVLRDGGLHSAGAPAEVLTAQMLAEVYGVEARVERCSQGRIVVMVEGVFGA